jgi:hypothetical protein
MDKSFTNLQSLKFDLIWRETVLQLDHALLYSVKIAIIYNIVSRVKSQKKSHNCYDLAICNRFVFSWFEILGLFDFLCVSF